MTLFKERDMHRLALVACTILIATGCSELDRMAGSREQYAPPVIIQAHRGAGELAPENTLPSFELAWQMGAVPEADVRTTRDGVMVAFHDNNFQRLIKDASPELARQGVGDLTWSDLSKLDVGAYKGDEFAGQRVPRMDDVFAAMRSRPGRLIYLDIKDVELEKMSAVLRQNHVDRQCILASTDESIIRRWKEILPTSKTLLWMGGSEAKLNARLSKLRDANFAGVDQLQVHVHVTNLQDADPFTPSSSFLRSLAAELESRGILFQVLPDSKDVAAYEKLLEMGVDSFATDFPKVALLAAQQAGRR